MMGRPKKLDGPVTLFAAIEATQHETLRTIAFQERRSLADIVREALTTYIKQRTVSRARPKKAARAAV